LLIKFFSCFLCAIFYPGSNGCNYANTLQLLNLSALLAERYQLGAVFFTSDFFLGGGRGGGFQNLPNFHGHYWSFGFPKGSSEIFLSFLLLHPSNAVPPPGVPLLRIQFIVKLTLSQDKLSHSGKFDIILTFIS